MRKVPRDQDPRTRAEKRKRDYGEYRSLWLDIDQDKMYPSAKRLYELKFEAGRATMGILTSESSMSMSSLPALSFEIWGNLTLLKSTRVEMVYHRKWPDRNGIAMWDVDRATSDFSYRICLSANSLWPLLVDQSTESEKTGYRVMIARVMLHELAVRIYPMLLPPHIANFSRI
jgi:hypothetical protein